MITLRIVELTGARFAIQARKGFFGTWGFCDKEDYCTWSRCDLIEKYCIADSLEEIEIALEEVIMDIKRRKRKGLKIIRVIKTVKVK